MTSVVISPVKRSLSYERLRNGRAHMYHQDEFENNPHVQPQPQPPPKAVESEYK